MAKRQSNGTAKPEVEVVNIEPIAGSIAPMSTREAVLMLLGEHRRMTAFELLFAIGDMGYSTGMRTLRATLLSLEANGKIRVHRNTHPYRYEIPSR